MKNKILFSLFLSLLVFGMFSCGKKAPPKPPEDFAPAAVRFLTVEGKTDGVLLFWHAPLRTATDKELVDLDKFIVRRSTYDKDQRPDFDDIAEIKIPKDTEEKPIAEQQVSKPPENKNDKNIGASYSYLDTAVQPGRVYDYLIVPVNEDGVEGDTSMPLRVTFLGESTYYENVGQVSPE